MVPPVSNSELSAMIVVICFSAGLNVYATVATMGLLAHSRVLTLPPHLHALESWWVIGVCGVLFLVEFIGDKIPVFDLLWNALHTFVRVPVAALIAYGATVQLPAWEQAIATLLGGTIALAAHGGKTAARTAITPSPEPLSNFTLSLGEDMLAVFLIWFATRHPFTAAAIVIVALTILLLLIKSMVGSLRNLLRDAEKVLIGAFQF